MEKNKSKEHFLVVYNNDFDESRQNHLNAMDAYVYVTMKLMAGNVYANNTVYATAAFQPIRRAIHQNAGARTAGKISGGHNMYNYVNNMYICCIKWVKKRHCTAKINIYKSSKMLEFARQSML